jgi:hypothetical protein
MGRQPAPQQGESIVKLNRRQLLNDLRQRVRGLEVDLREQVEEVLPEVLSRLRAEYHRAFRLGRTAATWTVWRDERITQAAVAWVLGTVFVRYCEDNGLLGESVFLTGPDSNRMTLAEESHEEYFRRYPSRTDRDWLLEAFGEIAQSQAGRLLFDREHNALYQIPISHDAAKKLIGFWRRRSDGGALVYEFTSANEEWDTRFLGDLYQDLSEAARKTYALLQTPPFVEDFILKLTLKPAVNEFGHEVVRAIDPTCGSGHFLLGMFRRLLAEWEKHAPTKDQHERVRLALDAVHGVDVNPFAVAIARFRLLVEALRVAGFRTLEEAKGYEFPLHVAVGDSLIKHREGMLFGEDPLAEFTYSTEDLNKHPGILDIGRYHVVVGNPPFVTVKDRSLNEAYRGMYSACAGKYALSVPFAQRFFHLAKAAENDGKGAGYVGQITANSFMKREFGRKLIGEFFSLRVNLTHVIDTSGAYIPGHGTPTVILIGRNTNRNRAGTIRTVMGIRGEPRAPTDPGKGFVWTAITSLIDQPYADNEWVSIADTPREELARFPWNLSGGGAKELTAQIEHAAHARFSDLIESVGFMVVTGYDDAFLSKHGTPFPWTESLEVTPFVIGDLIRDWTSRHFSALWPYAHGKAIDAHQDQMPYWSLRSTLRRGLAFGKTREERGLQWHEYTMLSWDRVGASLTIGYPFLSTHNHFYLRRDTSVLNHSAPVIKLPKGATEDEHLRLLGVLNSSAACFWLKQVSQKKGGANNSGGGRSDQPWSWSYEFTGTKLQELPLPAEYPLELTRELDRLAQRLSMVSPASVATEVIPTGERLARAEAEWHAIRARMTALQEELDWQVYHHYRLLDDELTVDPDKVPLLRLGERAFEIVLARRVARGEVATQWFAQHGSTPITELPEHWPAAYRAMVERRIEVIESNRHIGLIERPECKRRWATDGWAAMRAEALRGWLLDRCEARELWHHHVDGVEQPRPLSANQLADELRRDPDVLAVAELYAPGKDLARVLADLIADAHVPFLAALRYKPSGLAKRADWEDVWDKQREEDATPDDETKRKIRESIPVPPKYTSADFAKPSYWRNRGKLDVPKERFISYPHAGRDGDPSLLVGWAGWDHREQAQALAILIVEREQTDGWPAERLTPLLAGLREVLPWVRQWHGAFDPGIGDSPAAVYDGFLAETTNRLHLTDDDLTGWRPPDATRRRRKP